MDIKALLTTPKGRIPRSEYWIGMVMLIGFSMLFGFVLGMLGMGGEESTLGNIIWLVVSLAMLVVAFFLYIKRFHDMDKSGWFSLLMIIPFVNIAVGLFWLGFVKGTDGSNRFGTDPLSGEGIGEAVETPSTMEQAPSSPAPSQDHTQF